MEDFAAGNAFEDVVLPLLEIYVGGVLDNITEHAEQVDVAAVLLVLLGLQLLV